MLDKNTFGNMPASIYLADHLNRTMSDGNQGAHSRARYIAKQLDNMNRALNELSDCHLNGSLSATVFGRMLVSLRAQAFEAGQVVRPHDSLAADLMVNVMVGPLKSWNRRLANVSQKRRDFARSSPAGTSVPEFKAVELEETKMGSEDPIL